MTALVGVLRSAAVQLRVAESRAGGNWQSASVELLHRDLMLSSRIAFNGGWVWLEGEFPDYQSESARTKRVGYNCVPWPEGQVALVRLAGASTDLVAVGPRRLVLERLDQMSNPQPLSERPTATPDRLRLWIWEDEGAEPALVRDVVLR